LQVLLAVGGRRLEYCSCSKQTHSSKLIRTLAWVLVSFYSSSWFVSQDLYCLFWMEGGVYRCHLMVGIRCSLASGRFGSFGNCNFVWTRTPNEDAYKALHCPYNNFRLLLPSYR
jgi:hypothetical protein